MQPPLHSASCMSASGVCVPVEGKTPPVQVAAGDDQVCKWSICLGAGKGALKFPQSPGNLTGVAVAPNGSIFVKDYVNHQIHVFDAARKFVRSFGKEGEAAGQFRMPRNVAITREGLLYIASDKRVDVLRDDGVLVRRIGAGILNDPWDVTVHNEEIFVADWGNADVAVFNQEGKLVRTIGTRGTSSGQFSGPTGVAVSPDGKLHVSDRRTASNHHGQVFTPQGVYIREFGAGQLKAPQKLQFSSDKHVLVADNSNHRVAVFNHAIALVSSLPCANKPYGLAVDQIGDLLVACYGSMCVQIF